LKVTFLGTGTSQGVPVIGCSCSGCSSTDPMDKRLRSSVLLSEQGVNAVIDTGPDFRQQMLREEVRHLEAVVFTHEHRDHIAGLDDVRAFNFLQQQPMDVYAEERVIRALKYEFPYIFAEKKYPGVPQLDLHMIDMNSFSVGPMKFIPVRMMHYRLPVMGFRIGDFAYLTDGNFISEEEKEKLVGVKVLVINALRREKHISHFTVSEAVDLIMELSPRKAYLTHLSHQIGLQSDLRAELPEGIEPAYDGLVLDL